MLKTVESVQFGSQRIGRSSFVPVHRKDEEDEISIGHQQLMNLGGPLFLQPLGKGAQESKQGGYISATM